MDNALRPVQVRCARAEAEHGEIFIPWRSGRPIRLAHRRLRKDDARFPNTLEGAAAGYACLEGRFAWPQLPFVAGSLGILVLASSSVQLRYN